MDLDISRVRLDSRLDTLTKWFYICLLDLCKETGFCHLSIRELSLETKMAVGKIAGEEGMIRKLVETGYIQARKQPRPRAERPRPPSQFEEIMPTDAGGHEVWYIMVIGLSVPPQLSMPDGSSEKQMSVLHLDHHKITITVESRREGNGGKDS